jgi:hypothetical protein
MGDKAVLPGLVHPAWPDHGWCSLVRLTLYKIGRGMTDAFGHQPDLKPKRAIVPEPSRWNMAMPIIIVVAGVALGFFGVM